MGNTNQEFIYTDQENVWASQMAYCNINDALIKEVKRETNISEDLTFSQIVDYCKTNNIDLWYTTASPEAQAFLDGAETAEYGNWKVVSVCVTRIRKMVYMPWRLKPGAIRAIT